ncbi:MAG: hypothetical protein MI923_09330 [Phycisphaerales bacterium]|nr:hypothetical protein [Phycisphaerales bacterium]
MGLILNRRGRRRLMFGALGPFGYLLYLLILVAGAYLIYTLVPQDVIDAVKDTYVNPSAEIGP